MSNNLKKTCYILDSGSGYDPKINKIDDCYISPLIINLNDGNTITSFRDNVDMTRNELYKLIKDKKNLSTSQSSVGDRICLIDDLLNQYETILVFPMSRHLSGSYDSWLNLASDYSKERLVIFDTEDVAYGLIDTVLSVKKIIDNNGSILECQEFVENKKKRRAGTIMIDDLNIMIKGGRISPIKGKIAQTIGLKVLVSFSGSLSHLSNSFSFEKAIEKSFKYFDELINFRKNGIESIFIIGNYIDNDDAQYQKFIGLVNNWLDKNNIKCEKIIKSDAFLPAVVSVHTGIDTYTIYLTSK